MELMSGYSNGGENACQLPKTTAEYNYADDLNLFFNRFDKYDFSAEVENLRISLSSQNDRGRNTSYLCQPKPEYYNYVQIN